MKFPKLPRKPELDALRGLFLVWMTLTHLPTHFSDLVNQPFGFVSSAEGFVFLSALLVARLYIHQAALDEAGLRSKLWRRALKIYGYHLLMLSLAFTVAAGLAVTTHRTAIYNLLNFYIAHPVVAVVGSVLLLYCPPLLDILPMYVIFLAGTPLVLSAAVRWGWNRIIAMSLAVWLLAQFGLRDAVHNAVIHITHLPIPLQETGAFNLFAWQWIWIAGMWLGAKSAQGPLPISRVPGKVVALCAVVCAFFIGVRHEWFGSRLTQQTLSTMLDKWSIGPLRLLNLVAFTIVLYWLRKPVLRLVAVEPFLTLGKASLEVFCAHVFFVFFGLALLYGEMTQLHGYLAIGLLVFTFTGLILVALREVRRRRDGKERAAEGEKSSESTIPLPPTVSRFAE
ncbi:OpgC protein [Acidisarcina polymorpha]|uniref:OpgC protein n=1 Tax=Acidisarcina polymorpha TaxID=2211140 RepID=A0A2Z5G2K7_9BACT|nr:OpgC domain-containing protein [Acidisarcina polymorpha]AXC12766.1 OpgC protein [Acidisarcina polymorpha]